jgi:hypothetical protein
MNPSKIVGTLLIVAGAAGLAYGGFSYTRDKQTTQIGPLSLTVKDTHTVNVPVWAGVAAVALGAGLLLIPIRK